jgi:hypothetical protein
VSIIKDIYGKIVTFAARESEDFAASIGFDGRQGSSYETNGVVAWIGLRLIRKVSVSFRIL